MKNKILLLMLSFVISFTSFAQSPEGINYQAVIRDAANNILSSQNVGVQFKLLQGSPAGTSAYTETHSVLTDGYGLVALTIGTGATSDDFSTIDWSNGPYFLEIAADVSGGTSYNVLGTQQLMSVPYALYAKTSGSAALSNEITDDDSDTKIQVEKNANEDIIRFDIAGTEKWTMTGARLEPQNSGNSVLIGVNAGKNEDLTNNANIFIGSNSGLSVTDQVQNTAIGASSLQNLNSGFGNIAFGHQAGLFVESGTNNTFIGRLSGKGAANHTKNNNTFLGAQSGESSEAGNNTYIGFQSGQTNVTGTGNLFMGMRSGQNELGSNKLYIDNSNTTTPLVYGEFDTDLLRVNGTLNINNAFSFPTSDGTANQILQTNGSGNLSWQNNAASTVQTLIEDSDQDTKIQVEETGNDDTIRFDIKGTERLALKENTGGYTLIELPNNDANIFIGVNAGFTTVNASENIFIGPGAGRNNTGGYSNTEIGFQAGYSNISGLKNVMLGFQAGYSSAGSRNVMLGFRAGYNETGSQRLYIDGSSTTSPLIYGEFDNDLLRINGTLNINNAFSFPTTDGSVDQTLQTDGNGILTWGNATVDQTLSLSGTILSIQDGNSVDLSTVTIVQNVPDNTELTGQNASIDIQGDLEAGGNSTVFGDTKLAVKAGSTTTIGSNGTPINAIVKASITKDVPNISSNSTEWVIFTVPGARINGVVSISPTTQLDNKLMLGQAFVSGPNEVRVNFRNTGGTSSNPPNMTYHIAVIQ